jgi:hypothetical protein
MLLERTPIHFRTSPQGLFLCLALLLSMACLISRAKAQTPTPTPSPTPTPTPIGAIAYYVDNSGSPACSDSNPGTSQSVPWCTIARAMTQLSSLQPNDSILFKCGDTWNEQFDLRNVHGSAGHPVVIGHYGANCALPNGTYTALLPTISGGSIRSYGIDALSTSVSYVTVDGFDIHDVTKEAIGFQTSGGAMPGITIKNNLIHQDGPGACAGCGSPADSGGYVAQIDFSDYTQGQNGVQILNNTIWDVGGHNAMHVHYDTSPNVLVQGNIVGPGCIHNCIDTKGINGQVKNNIATCPASSARGAQCSSVDAGFYSENTYVSGSTSPTWIGNIAHDIALGFQVQSAVTPRLYNNTVCNVSQFAAYLQTCTNADVQKNIIQGTIADNCVATWDYNDDWGPGNPIGPHDINVDPQFVNPAGNPPDFRPQNVTVQTAGAPDSMTPFAYIGALRK